MGTRRNVCLGLFVGIFAFQGFFGQKAFGQDADFNLVQPRKNAFEAARPQADKSDQNIDFDQLLRKVELEELPKGYRHHYLGSEGYRPNTFALSVGGRTPGVGVTFDYSFNRLGFGVSASYRPVVGFRREFEDEATRGTGQQFFNGFVFYNLISYPVSPYVIVGLEYATRTQETIQVMAGLGVEARIYYGLTLFLEYVRHETDKNSFPGLGLGWAF